MSILVYQRLISCEGKRISRRLYSAWRLRVRITRKPTYLSLAVHHVSSSSIPQVVACSCSLWVQPQNNSIWPRYNVTNLTKQLLWHALAIFAHFAPASTKIDPCHTKHHLPTALPLASCSHRHVHQRTQALPTAVNEQLPPLPQPLPVVRASDRKSVV